MASHGRAVFHDGLRLKRTFASTFEMQIDIGAEPTASWLLRLPENPPESTSTYAIASDGTVSYQPVGGGGTVTTFSAGNLSPLFSASVATATTTPALSFTLTNQAINTVFAGPSTGVAAAPTFRSLVYADISGLVGTAANTIAAGNDSRLHAQNTDTGTTSVSFQLDSGNGGPRVRNESGVLAVRNSADTAYADLTIRNLTVQGTTTTVNTETVDVADNILNINSNVTTGTPTENMGIRGARGASTAASLIFNEATDSWTAGLEGSEIPVARVAGGSFTNATLVAGVLTATHGLGNQWPNVVVYDNNNRRIDPDEITATNVTVTTIDLTTFGTITGSWRWTAVG
ncbi:MAG: hypothetical protein ACRC62_29560 [Microcoleus sp.]